MIDVNATSDGDVVENVGLGAQIKGRVSVAHDALDQLLSPEFQRLGLTPGEADVLTVLLIAEDHTLAPTDLADWLGLTTAGLTARLNALEERSLIERRLHPTDGRRRTVHFTPEGLDRAETVMRLKDDVVAEHVVTTLGDEDAARLVGLLDTVISAATAATIRRPRL